VVDTPARSKPLALVTGASLGIGEQFARILAAKGYDLVLVARGEARLQLLADELSRGFGAGCAVLAADLSTSEGVASVEKRITDGPAFDTVINNAGFAWRGEFVDEPPDDIAEMVRLNVLALSALSRAALAVMVARRSGRLLNVASMAAFLPGPSEAVYYATKAYVLSLTQALHEEVKSAGVHVSALCPGITPTNFQDRAGSHHDRLPRFAMTGAARVAAEGLAALEENRAVCIPGGLYKAFVSLVHLAPRSVVRRGAGRWIAGV